MWLGQNRGSQAPRVQFKNVILGFMKNFLQGDHTETLVGCWSPQLDGVGLSHLRLQWVCSAAELVSALDLHFWNFLPNLVLFEVIAL